MSRLDNSAYETRRVMAETTRDPKWAEKHVPGETEPVDVCWGCYDENGFYDCPEMDDHPPYEDHERYCVLCTSLLTEEDN